MVWLPDVENKFDDMFSHCDTTPASDRQTDRQTDRWTGQTDNLQQHSLRYA